MQSWTGWRRFPDARHGGMIEAPIGPGVYEVRHAETGEVVAFGHATNVANAISELKVSTNTGIVGKLLHRTAVLPVSELEYRACAAKSRAEARVAAARLSGLRRHYWTRRMQLGWAARHSR
jgi:hypothetical protein